MAAGFGSAGVRLGRIRRCPPACAILRARGSHCLVPTADCTAAVLWMAGANKPLKPGEDAGELPAGSAALASTGVQHQAGLPLSLTFN